MDLLLLIKILHYSEFFICIWRDSIMWCDVFAILRTKHLITSMTQTQTWASKRNNQVSSAENKHKEKKKK